MEIETIDISGLSKAAVLAALYNRAKAQGIGFMHYTSEDMSIGKAQALLDAGGTYFDYVQGRVMKISLITDELDPWLYDRDNGPGAAAAVIQKLRENHG